MYDKLDIRRLLWRVFPPYEVWVTRRDINALLSADGGLCVEQVRSEALRLTKNAARVVHSIRIDRMKADQLALILIHNALLRNLETGQNHSHRGRLSAIGNDMLRLWRATEKELLKRRYLTEEEHATDTSELQQAIAQVG